MKKKINWTDLLIFALIIALAAASIWYYDFRNASRTMVDYYDDRETISFGWWGNDERHQYTMEGVDLFEKENDAIAVDCRYSVWSGYAHRYRVYMLSGTEPDVMLVNYNWLKEYSPDGTGYYDLYQLSDVIDLSAFTEEQLKSGVVNGHLNALPTAYNAVVFYYNQSILNEYGLAVPKTWDDLKKAAEVLYPHGIYPLYMNEKHFFLCVNAHYEQTEKKQAFAADGVYTGGTDAAKEFLSFYRELVDSHVLRNIEENDADEFSRGGTAGAAFWASDADRYCKNMKESGYDMVLGSALSTEDGDFSGWYVKPATMYAIRADTAYPEEAAKLLDFLVNDPDMARLQGVEKGIPVSARAREALSETDLSDGFSAEAGNAVLDHLSDLRLMNPSLENEDVIRAFKDVSAKYIYGKEDLDTAAEELSDELIKITEQ